MDTRRRMAVRGTVQGVGFRPFAYRLAREMSLTGFVLNDGIGATLELQGGIRDLEVFERRLVAEVPDGARIDQLLGQDIPPVVSENSFVIQDSRITHSPAMSLVPDRHVCAACLDELADPRNRRYRYPFINCTRCGPRYTITEGLPYDRQNTTMARFEMCPECRQEFENPLDRRFHAQPIACPVCGPSIWLETGSEVDTADPLAAAARMLKAGSIVAVKGIGGFHLAVDANNRDAVARLRGLKKRPRKPLALMARDMTVVRELIEVDDTTETLLRSPAAPIVVARAEERGAVSAWVAEGLGDLGVMLPYSPVHHLLFVDGPDCLVLTSGNAPSEPIATENADARLHLPADGFLMHDRDIHVANDDSVIRTNNFGFSFLRRSRGYVPEALDASMLPRRSVLALGPLLKVTVSMLHGGQLIVGRHLGDLGNLRAEEALVAETERMLAFSDVQPEVAAVDLHPETASSDFARERFPDVPIVRVQHHHAHMASVMVEHGLGVEDRVAGIILDGLGYGEDGAVWGGEVLVGGYGGFERASHLRYVPQPGGDRAALEPRRMAISLLLDAGIEGASVLSGWDEDVARIALLREMSPLTSSAGRLFDGVAAILDLTPREQDFEGEAAGRLEAAAVSGPVDGYPLPQTGDILDTRALISALVADPSDTGVRAARFIAGLADGLVQSALRTECERVVLGGGCLVNRLLLSRLVYELERHGVTPMFPRRLPPGDGGVSAGQAACAAVFLTKG